MGQGDTESRRGRLGSFRTGALNGVVWRGLGRSGGFWRGHGDGFDGWVCLLVGGAAEREMRFSGWGRGLVGFVWKYAMRGLERGLRELWAQCLRGGDRWLGQRK